MASGHVLSVKQLAGAVEKAVKVAADRHKLQFEPAYTINGLINGRMVREAANLDMNALRKASAEIADQASGAVGGAGAAAVRVHLEPAVLVSSKFILCGFIPPPHELLGFE